MYESPPEFESRREEGNKLISEYGDRVTKRFLSLDSQVYRDGRLDRKTKELLGLVASLVLRCDDCISYHIRQCNEHDLTTEELIEALNVGSLVGGTIVIPHLRKALQFWEELQQSETGGKQDGR